MPQQASERIMAVVLVHMAETKWTISALACACEQARREQGEVILLKLLPANFLDWRGWKASEYLFSESEREDIAAYQALARQYGVPLRVHVMRATDEEQAIAAAAEQFDAASVYAAMPVHALRHLARDLELHQHQVYGVQQPAAAVGDVRPQAQRAETMSD
jgi:hypothetical protein